MELLRLRPEPKNFVQRSLVSAIFAVLALVSLQPMTATAATATSSAASTTTEATTTPEITEETPAPTDATTTEPELKTEAKDEATSTEAAEGEILATSTDVAQEVDATDSETAPQKTIEKNQTETDETEKTNRTQSASAKSGLMFARTSTSADECDISEDIVYDESEDAIESGVLTLKNTSEDCTYDIGLASYEKYDNDAPEDINSQILHDSEEKTLEPGDEEEFEVDVPSCAFQIDLFEGDLIESFADGDRYGDRKLNFAHDPDRFQAEGQLCEMGDDTDPEPEPKVCEEGDANFNPEADLEVVAFDAINGTTEIENSSEKCGYRVGLAAYKAFTAEGNGTLAEKDQELFSSATGTIAAAEDGENATKSFDINTDTPNSCAYQIDAFYGDIVQSFDSNEDSDLNIIKAADGVIADTDDVDPNSNGFAAADVYEDNLCEEDDDTTPEPTPELTQCPFDTDSDDVYLFSDSRLISQGIKGPNADNKETAVASTTLSSGTYDIEIYTFDTYEGLNSDKPRSEVSQPHEQAFLSLRNDGEEVARTGITKELADNQETAATTTTFADVEVDGAVDQLVGVHAFYNDQSSANSLEFGCAKIEKEESTPDPDPEPELRSCPLTEGSGEGEYDRVINFSFSDDPNATIGLSGRNATEAQSSIETLNLEDGEYRIALYSEDADEIRGGQDQDFERYFLELTNGGAVVGTTTHSIELPDGSDAASTTKIIPSYELTASSTDVQAKHYGFFTDQEKGSANSHFATCAGFDRLEDEEETPATTTVTIVKDVVNDDGGDATSSDFTLTVKDSEGTTVDSFAGSESGTDVEVTVGASYTVSESGEAMADYSQSFSGACDASGSFTASSSSSSQTCTLINNDKDDGSGGSGGGNGDDDATTTVSFVKTVINDDEGSATSSDFTLTIRDEDGTEVESFAGSASGTDVTLEVGETYSVSESGTSTDEYTASFSGACDVSGDITASSSSDTCTLTNDDIEEDGGGGGGGDNDDDDDDGRGGGGGDRLEENDDDDNGGGGGDRLEDDDDGEVAGAQDGPTDEELNDLLNQARQQLQNLLSALNAPQQMPETGDGSLAN